MCGVCSRSCYCLLPHSCVALHMSRASNGSGRYHLGLARAVAALSSGRVRQSCCSLRTTDLRWRPQKNTSAVRAEATGGALVYGGVAWTFPLRHRPPAKNHAASVQQMGAPLGFDGVAPRIMRRGIRSRRTHVAAGRLASSEATRLQRGLGRPMLNQCKVADT